MQTLAIVICMDTSLSTVGHLPTDMEVRLLMVMGTRLLMCTVPLCLDTVPQLRIPMLPRHPTAMGTASRPLMGMALLSLMRMARHLTAMALHLMVMALRPMVTALRLMDMALPFMSMAFLWIMVMALQPVMVDIIAMVLTPRNVTAPIPRNAMDPLVTTVIVRFSQCRLRCILKCDAGFFGKFLTWH